MGGPYLPTGFQAYSKLIAKKGKNPTNPAFYRPISLIYLDSKILPKIIASRLADILPHIIHPVQAGFVKGRSVTLNIRKTVMALELAKSHPDILKKAFDNISLHWIFLVMQKRGFTGPILELVKNMYSSSNVRLITSGYISEVIRLTKGTLSRMSSFIFIIYFSFRTTFQTPTKYTHSFGH